MYFLCDLGQVIFFLFLSISRMRTVRLCYPTEVLRKLIL